MTHVAHAVAVAAGTAAGSATTDPTPSPKQLEQTVQALSGWETAAVIAGTVVAATLAVLAVRFVVQLVARHVADSGLEYLPSMPGPAAARRRARHQQRTATGAAVIRSGATFVIVFIALLTVLDAVGVDLSKVFAGVGVITLIVGFGSQQLIRDFFTGISMLAADQYGVGDRVDFGTVAGTVEAVSLRITRLRADDGVIWYLRNGDIPRVGNKSQGSGQVSIDVTFPAPVPPDTAREALVSASDGVRADPAWRESVIGPADIAGMVDFSGDSYVLRVLVPTRPFDVDDVAAELRARIWPAVLELTARFAPPEDDDAAEPAAEAEAAGADGSAEPAEPAGPAAPASAQPAGPPAGPPRARPAEETPATPGPRPG